MQSISVPEVISGDFRKMLKGVKDESADLVILDWPFMGGGISPTVLKMYHEGIRETARILSQRGNAVSVHYIVNNFYVFKEAEYYGLKPMDMNVVQLKMKTKHKNRMGQSYITIQVYSKNEMARIFNDSSRKIKGGKYFVLSHVLSDLWEGQFRNGYSRKAYNESIPEAMPKSVVKKIMDIYSTPDSVVVDCFGGAGNFPLECLQRGLQCTAAEINSNHLRIINRRLADAAKLLVNKAAQAYTIGDYYGREKEAEEKQDRASSFRGKQEKKKREA